MSKKVSYMANDLPPLTDEQRRNLERLASKQDHEIDTSDQPELTAAELSEMKPGRLYRPVKQQITARIDADVLAWLKSEGRGYQSRMNKILRRAMKRAMSEAQIR